MVGYLVIILSTSVETGGFSFIHFSEYHPDASERNLQHRHVVDRQLDQL